LQLKRIIRDDGKVDVLVKGGHSSEVAAKKRGFSFQTTEIVLSELAHGKRPKIIAQDLTSGDTDREECGKVAKAISNKKYWLAKQRNNAHGMKYMDDMKHFIEERLVSTKEQFDKAGKQDYLLLDKNK